MTFVAFLKEEVKRRGAAGLEARPPFDEKALFEENAGVIASSLGGPRFPLLRS